jgi:outer membrane protein W
LSGTELDRELSIEAGLGYHEYVLRRDEEDHYFSKVPLSLRGLRTTTASRSTAPFVSVSGGIAYYVMPNRGGLSGLQAIVKYKNAFGYHLGIGADVVSQAGWFASLDVKYAFVSFTAKEMKENGIKTSATYPEWQKIDGSGPLVSIGLGYRF